MPLRANLSDEAFEALFPDYAREYHERETRERLILSNERLAEELRQQRVRDMIQDSAFRFPEEIAVREDATAAVVDAAEVARAGPQDSLPTMTRKEIYRLPEFKWMASGVEAFYDRWDRAPEGTFLHLLRQKRFKGPGRRTYKYAVDAVREVLARFRDAARDASIVDEEIVLTALGKLGVAAAEGRRILEKLEAEN